MGTTVGPTPPMIVVTSPDSEVVKEEITYENKQLIKTGYKRWPFLAQFNALLSAFFIFTAAGLDLALGLGWNQYTGIENTHHFQFCWFIGVIAGVLITSFLVKIFRKIVFYSFGALLTLIAGTIYICAPQTYTAIIAARYIGGIGVGAITVPYIAHASEISHKNFRGVCTGLEQFGLTLGIAIQVIYASQWNKNINFAANRLHGILVLSFAFLALLCLIFNKESPLYYMQKHDEKRALILHYELIREKAPSEATQQSFEELKLYLNESSNRSICSSLMPFVKVLIYRCFVAFSFSLPLSLGLQLSTIQGGYHHNWPAIVYAFLRFLGGLIAIHIIDTYGRKLILLISLCCMHALMLTISCIIANPANIERQYWMDVICGIILTFSFFAGLFTPTTTSYLGEATPLYLKHIYAGLCIIMEQLVHIIVIVTFVYDIDAMYVYMTIVCLILILGFVFFGIALPETSGLALLEAQYSFKHQYETTNM